MRRRKWREEKRIANLLYESLALLLSGTARTSRISFFIRYLRLGLHLMKKERFRIIYNIYLTIKLFHGWWKPEH
jgi:hypothetical protein